MWRKLLVPIFNTPITELVVEGRVNAPATCSVLLGVLVPIPRRRLAVSQKRLLLFCPIMAVEETYNNDPAVPLVTAPPMEAPADAHDNMPEPLVESTWPDEPSAEGQPYAMPFKVVVADTDIRVKAMLFVPVAVIVGEEPVNARVEEVIVTPRTFFALMA